MQRMLLKAGLLTAAFCLIHTSVNGDKEKNAEHFVKEGYKINNIESAIIVYELSGMQSGRKEVYFDHYGWRKAEYTQATTELMGTKTVENRLSLIDGEWQYNIDLDKKTGTKVKNPLLQQIADGNTDKSLAKAGEEMLKGMGAKKTGTAMMLGKNCDVWEAKSMGTKIWAWNSVELKTETTMMGMTQGMTAVKFEANASIPADKFAIPEGIDFSGSAHLQEMMNKFGKKK